jgi:hypothetical protein
VTPTHTHFTCLHRPAHVRGQQGGGAAGSPPAVQIRRGALGGAPGARGARRRHLHAGIHSPPLSLRVAV